MMDREEAKDFLIDEYGLVGCGDGVDKIFDDLESRTCENCKHLRNGYCVPHQRKIHSIPITASQKVWISHIGCNNKFERM